MNLPKITVQFEDEKYPRVYEVECIKFSGGELHVIIPSALNLTTDDDTQVKIATRIQSSDDLMILVIVMDILRRHMPHGKFELFLPYFPYARQDRVTEYEGAFSLKAFAKIINSLGFTHIKSLDCHSDVTAAVVDNLYAIPAHRVIIHYTYLLSQDHKFDAIIAPDAGSVKKVEKIAGFFKKPMIVCTKTRDVKTGELLPPTVCADSVPERVLIVDDICDGGGTFIALATALRAKGAKHISLYVTHGIFSKGLGVFDGLIDMFYTTDSFTSPLISAPPANLIVDKVFE